MTIKRLWLTLLAVLWMGCCPLWGANLCGVRLVKDPCAVNRSSWCCQNSVEVEGLPYLCRNDFCCVVNRYVGQPLTDESIQCLVRDIVCYCNQRGCRLVDVVVPEQNVTNGCLQLLVVEAVAGSVCVNDGCWFKAKSLRCLLNARPGCPIDPCRVRANLDWLNRNPFRSVDLIYQKGVEYGKTDLIYAIRDRRPWRVYGGYNNYGNQFTGTNRLFAGGTYGNVLGLGHVVNYQYTFDAHLSRFQSHTASYTAPLPWRHLASLFGAYESTRPSMTTPFHGEGEYWQVSGRYTIPLRSCQCWTHECELGYDYKSTDSNLFFDVDQVFGKRYAISQFVLGYLGSLTDRFGTTSYGITGYYSPGGIGKFNNTADFEQFRIGAKADYCYFRGFLERVTPLPYCFSWVFRGTGQATTDRLMVSEQLGIGGFNTVRGFEERQANGDRGWFINNEAYTPPLKVLKRFSHSKSCCDELRFLGFWDIGAVYNVQAPEGENNSSTLSGVGLGLRYHLGTTLTIKADYGVQVKNSAIIQRKLPQRLNMIVSLSY